MAKALKRYDSEENKEYFKKHEIDEKNSLLVHKKRSRQAVFDLLNRFDDPTKIYESYEDELKNHGIGNKAEFMCHYYSYLNSKDKIIDNVDLAIIFAKNGTEIADRMRLLEVPFVYKVAIELNRRINKKIIAFERVTNLVIWSAITFLLSAGYGYSIGHLNADYSIIETMILFGMLYLVTYWMMNNNGFIAKAVHKVAKVYRKIMLGISSVRKDTDDLFEYVKEYERWDYRYRFFTDKFYSNTVQNAKDIIMNTDSNLSNDVTCAKLSDLNPAIQGEECNWEVFKTFKFAEMFVGNNWRSKYLSSVNIDESVKTLQDAIGVRSSNRDCYSSIAILDDKLNKGYPAVFEALTLNKNYYVESFELSYTALWFFIYVALGATLNMMFNLNNYPESAASVFAITSLIGFVLVDRNHLKALRSSKPLSNDESVNPSITKYIRYSDIADAAEFKFTGKVPDKTADNVPVIEVNSSKDKVSVENTAKDNLVEAKGSNKTVKNTTNADAKQNKKVVGQAELSADNIETIKNPENKIYFDGNYISTNERITRCLNIEILKVKGNKYQENKSDEFRVRLANIKSKLNNLANILAHEDSYFPHDIELCKKFYRIYLPGIANSFDNIKQFNENNLKEEYLKKLLIAVDDILDGILDAIDDSVKLNIDVELDTLEKLKELHGLVNSL